MTNLNRKNLWKNLKPYEVGLYQGEARTKLTAVGILKLDDAEIEANFENIAVVLHKIFPENFSLMNFPEHPDTLRVWNQVKENTKAGYIDGSLKKNSYMLTSKGRAVAEDLLRQIESGTMSQVKRSGWKDNKYIKLVKGVSDTDGFEKFSDKRLKEIKKFDVCESLHCTLDADEFRLKRNLETLIRHASSTKKISNYADISESVLEYLQYIESNWEELMK